ncbi:hypothetical protein R5W24_002845 [Gemmata sp. JC717]|uniref:hypothetical protein n=1 Tax=Gemmata algarum TaxID=2975278 RepID=UPI0021BB5E5D|nr:hypothetical protein [Gemmata algarum]MDY3553732.1 hypothetical protein [Gemmata algarum]
MSETSDMEQWPRPRDDAKPHNEWSVKKERVTFFVTDVALERNSRRKYLRDLNLN